MVRIPAILLFILPILTWTGSGQQMSHPVMASRDDLFYAPRPLLTGPDTVRVLAVMVQFQQDDINTTTGNGRFDLSTTSDPILDPPPHNGLFFEAHLTFLRNYFAKASDGKQIVTTTLVDTIYTLPNVMRNYSPQRGENNLKLAQLAQETWGLVDASGKVTDYSAYDCFVIFHAGTGRDIDLTSLFGFDPTPHDIPSIFFGPGGFRDAFGRQYPGIVVNSGQDTIWNSAILPETENRLIPTLTGDILLEISFNGLLCASVASYLGLPDLFNTETGGSAIGRFGLMDGQSIFSYFGVFPPEPSAWEKYYLGWIAPIDAGSAEQTFALPAVSAVTTDTVYRFAFSATEYFLVENRQRDPGGNGQMVTSVFNGTTVTKTYPRDTTGFNAFDVSDLAGVITDVEDLDWSLPGGVDVGGNRLTGGALVWHIDESLIQRKIGTNSINADPAERGVDLEEADGSQDIGQDYGFLSAGSGSEEGTALDFWYEGNPVPVFENLFSATTFPASRSNAGAFSLVTLSGFSAAGARMTFTGSMGDGATVPMAGFPRTTGELLPDPSLAVAPLQTGGGFSILVTATGEGVPEVGLEGDTTVAAPAPGKLFAWTPDGGAAMTGGFSDGRIVAATNSGIAARLEGAVSVRDLNNDGIPELILVQEKEGAGSSPVSILKAVTPVDMNGDSLADQLFELTLGHVVSTIPVAADSMIAVGAGPMVYFIRHDGVLVDSVQAVDDALESVAGISVYAQPFAFLITGSDGSISVHARTTDGSIQEIGYGMANVGSPVSGPAVTGFWGANGETGHVVATTTDGVLSVLTTKEGLAPLHGFPVSTGLPCSVPPALADINSDGVRDIVMFAGNRIFVYNISGAVVDNFPVTLDSEIASAPVVADIDGDLDLDIIAVTVDGFVAAIDRSGRYAAGFPLQAGKGRQSVAVLEVPTPSFSSFDIGLVVASIDEGSVTGWTTGSVPSGAQALFPWPQYQRDAARSGLVTGGLSGTPVSSSFFPADRVYNWPNPVYDGNTHFRFFVGEDARVRITVFDLAGDLVSELTADAVGGIDNEIRWDVSGIESGIYFAHVEASGTGNTGNAVIKVAIVK